MRWQNRIADMKQVVRVCVHMCVCISLSVEERHSHSILSPLGVFSGEHLFRLEDLGNL